MACLRQACDTKTVVCYFEVEIYRYVPVWMWSSVVVALQREGEITCLGRLFGLAWGEDQQRKFSLWIELRYEMGVFVTIILVFPVVSVLWLYTS